MNTLKTCGALAAAGLLALGSVAAGAAEPDAAQISRGKQVFQACIACHSTVKGQQGVGPSLVGIFDTKAGDVPGYRFSGPMKRSGLTLDEATLDKFLENPQAEIPGTRMPFAGLPDAGQREAVIAYLKTLK